MSKPFLPNAISYLLHPILMPSIGVVIIIYLSPYFAIFIAPPIAKITTLTMLLLTLTCPISATLYFIRKKNITSLHIEDRQQRQVPLTYTLLFYTLTCSVLKFIPGIPLVIYFFVLGTTLAILAALIINFSWKISTHMIGIGCVVGMIIGLSYNLKAPLDLYILSAVFLAGMIAYARLKLNAHSPLQVFIGFLVGLVSQFILFL